MPSIKKVYRDSKSAAAERIFPIVDDNLQPIVQILHNIPNEINQLLQDKVLLVQHWKLML